MNGKDFAEVVDLIVKEDSRYNKGAYFFVRKALDFTLKGIANGENKETLRKSNHVSGGELLDGIRKFALDQFGPMTLTVFEHWGVTESSNFGDVVFNLVEYGVFGKTERDSKADFKARYNFNEAFVAPFLPSDSEPEKAAGKREDPPTGADSK